MTSKPMPDFYSFYSTECAIGSLEHNTDRGLYRLGDFFICAQLAFSSSLNKYRIALIFTDQ